MKFKAYATATLVFLIMLGAATAFAKLEYFTKELPKHPGLSCMSCHQSIPKSGDKDNKLNDTGKQYEKIKKLPSHK